MMWLFKKIIGLSFLGWMAFTSAQEVTAGPHTFGTHGYLRTGMGRALSGGEMVQFQAPGTLGKPRLGNEANQYAELGFDYTYQPEGRNDSFDMVYMMAAYMPYATEEAAGNPLTFTTTQLYFKWKNFYKNADIWMGQRYYDRQYVEILDWFWLNSAQEADIGIGIEDIELANQSTLDVAAMRFSDHLEDPNILEKYFEDYKLEVRLNDIALNKSLNLSLFGQLGYRLGVHDTPYEDKTGFAVGAWTTYEKGNFYNRTSAIYRKGVSMINTSFSGKGLLEVTAVGEQVYNLDESDDLQIVSDFRYDDKSKHGFLGALAYQYKNFGIDTPEGNDKTFSYVNATGRYSYYLSNRVHLTLEAGYDHINEKDGESGGLGKLTFSPELKWKKGMSSRPVIRPFITYATWSEDLKGQVGIFNGNDAYADKTSGVTAGLQVELWW